MRRQCPPTTHRSSPWLNRRGLLSSLAAAPWMFEHLCGPIALALQPDGLHRDERKTSEVHLATFRVDVSPPLGHGCCGNWIKPIEGYDDPLEAVGLVLMGMGKPIVLCAVDWTGILNQTHLEFRQAIAQAADTSPDRVAVHVVHQHNAPMACIEAAKILAPYPELPPILDEPFLRRTIQQIALAVEQAKHRGVKITAIGYGQAAVQQVAANRRILNDKGVVRASRGSSCKDPELQALPEGTIDPMLKTIAFYSGIEKVAACHYFACHPMSYYGDGRASADFCGLARRRRQADEPGCAHLYFTGCAGNIGAGKYNDGSPAMRPILTQRIYDAILASESRMQMQPIQSISWSNVDLVPSVDPRWDEEALLKQVADTKLSTVGRSRPAYTLSWIRRCAQATPLPLSALRINQAALLHLPAEVFVEYQLQAQTSFPEMFLAMAAYGDGGPWYIPTAEAYPQQGYEVSVAWSPRSFDPILTQAIRALCS